MKFDRDETRILEALSARGPELIDRAVAWSRISSGSRNLDGLNAQAAALEQAFAVLGPVERRALAPSEIVDADGQVREQAHPPALILRVRPEAPVQVVLTGHYDTVYPAGTDFLEVKTRADGALHGPGIADMKGGLSVMLGALEALKDHPERNRLGYCVVLSPDEEIGSVASGPVLAQAARSGHVGLTYEPAVTSGALAAARKGSGNFHVVFRGRSAHAGREFERGRNAIAAAARFAAAIDALNGEYDGLTLNVARIDGGGPPNVVPDVAVVRFNVRLPDAAARDWVTGEIDRLLAEGAGEGITSRLHGGVTRPPKPFDEAQRALFEAVRGCGEALGQTIAWEPSGGVCEGNNLHAAGLPNVDTLGVRGGDIHSPEEFAWPDSFAERAMLSAAILMKLTSGEVDARQIKALRD
jgi:glutamate carboxypeptidase